MKFSFRHSIKWSIFISITTFLLACAFSITTTSVLEGASWGLGMLTVLVLVLIGIVFDIMGLASAAAQETPFHAMASKRVAGSRQAINIVRNADRFSNFCNDVIGDISGIISGTASALVVLKLIASMDSDHTLIYATVSVVFSGVVSALTVGGKALGKSFAIYHATDIVLWIGKGFYFLEHRFGIRIFQGKRSKLNNGKRGNKRDARTNQPT